MTVLKPLRMNADEFLIWAMDQPGRYELAEGEVVAMAPECVGHARTKNATLRSLERVIAVVRLDCEAFPDGMAVRIDDRTILEPDASVRCGDRLHADAIDFSDPVVVVEVLSSTTRAYDLGSKVEAYFRLASIRHYLIVKTDTRSVIHHSRAGDGTIVTRIVTEGILDLDPPGISIATNEIFRSS